MLARKFLIPLKTELAKLKKAGKTVSTPLFELLITKNNFPYPRFAFIVSKKVVRQSADRHQVKRRLADACRDLKISGDFVFFAKKAIVGKSIEELKREVNKVILSA